MAYHTPCHLEKLGWGVFSEKLLRMIPGVEFTLLDSACCGIAGTYGFKKENYEASQAIGRPPVRPNPQRESGGGGLRLRNLQMAD